MKLQALYARDRGTCWVCTLWVPPIFGKAGNPIAATRDHVVPLVDGGDDSPGNLRLAHELCNHTRGSSKSAGDLARAKASVENLLAHRAVVKARRRAHRRRMKEQEAAARSRRTGT